MKQLPILQHKPPLARSLRDCRLAGNNERRLRLSKTSNSTPEGDGGDITFRRNGFRCAFLCAYVLCFFSLVVFFCLIRDVSKQVREARIIFTGCESDWDANQMRELLLYQYRSVHRLQLAPTKGVLCTTLFLSSASRSTVLFRYCR